MAKQKKVTVVKPQVDPTPPQTCPKGFVWSARLGKCVADVG